MLRLYPIKSSHLYLYRLISGIPRTVKFLPLYLQQQAGKSIHIPRTIIVNGSCRRQRGMALLSSYLRWLEKLLQLGSFLCGVFVHFVKDMLFS
jgi:hypothetical protein